MNRRYLKNSISKKSEHINLKPLVTSEVDQLRIGALFIQLFVEFIYKNQISTEDQRRLAKIFHAYYKTN
ncbi:TPA_asm: hypothetical protein GYP43_02860 [Listeria monocytogenes]|nr:hypothetical protein [Listeria monocytogenes]